MQLYRLGAGLPIALAISVAVGQPIRAALAVRRTSQALDLQLHQAMRGKADHLTQQIGIGALLQQCPKAHHLIGHRQVLGSR